MYLFPKLDAEMYPIVDDKNLILEFLKQERVLLVQGTAFNAFDKQHFRIVFLPDQDNCARPWHGLRASLRGCAKGSPLNAKSKHAGIVCNNAGQRRSVVTKFVALRILFA